MLLCVLYTGKLGHRCIIQYNMSTKGAFVTNQIIDYLRSFLIILANGMVMAVLRGMSSPKKPTAIFFGQLAFSAWYWAVRTSYTLYCNRSSSNT